MKYQEENERLNRELPENKQKLKHFKKVMADLNKQVQEKNRELKLLKKEFNTTQTVFDQKNKQVRLMKEAVEGDEKKLEMEKAEAESLMEHQATLKEECDQLLAEINA